jgi:hypothetical protein
MTEFQQFVSKNSNQLLNQTGVLFDRFLTYYPELTVKEARKEYDRQINELFFQGMRK